MRDWAEARSRPNGFSRIMRAFLAQSACASPSTTELNILGLPSFVPHLYVWQDAPHAQSAAWLRGSATNDARLGADRSALALSQLVTSFAIAYALLMKVNKILTDVGEAALMTPVLFTGGLASSMPPLPRPHSRINLLALISTRWPTWRSSPLTSHTCSRSVTA